VRNRTADDRAVVEVPAIADASGIVPRIMPPLPEAITAMLRTQASIQTQLVQAYSENSRGPLLQALLLDPAADSYRDAVAIINDMFNLQKDVPPPMAW